MSDRRKGDVSPHAKFRANRFFKDNHKWYFQTREGTMEGPFDDRLAAERRLEQYIKVMVFGHLPNNHQLSIEPIEPE